MNFRYFFLENANVLYDNSLDLIALFQIFKNGTMNIRRVFIEDNGMYGCVANNTAGVARWDFYLRVTSKPKQRRISFYFIGRHHCINYTWHLYCSVTKGFVSFRFVPFRLVL